MNPQQRTTTHRVFIAGIILKGLNALLEICASLFLLVTGSVTGVFSFLFHGAITSAHSQIFASEFLFIHGIAKILIVIALFSRRIWAYKTAEIVLFLFILYQIYEYTRHGTWWLLAISIFDTALLWLTWREHQTLKNKI